MKGKIMLIKETILNILHEKEKAQDPNPNENEVISEATFEQAISATGFGKFNYLLLLLSVPCGWASMMETNTMSYVIPTAHCDLDLDLQQKGMLNAITYLGMISSAILWGFLADTLGRKKIMVAGFLADAAFITTAGLAQNYEMLLVAKYVAGLIMNGPFAAFTTAVSEYHCAKYRTRVVLLLAISYSVAQLIIPGIAWWVIPRKMDYVFLDGNFKLHSWNFFILICAIPSFVSSIGHCFLPESPKFLMTIGKNEQALNTFKKVYTMNTGLHPDTFPYQVKSLVDEIKLNVGGKHGGLVTANRTKIQALKEGWQQIAPIFFPPHILKLTLAAVIEGGFVLGTNTIRLWLPQIFTAISDYQVLYPGTSASLCTMLEIITPTDNSTSTDCIVNEIDDFVYINTIIVGLFSLIVYCSIGSIVNRLGKVPIMTTLAIISGVCAVCMYFAQDTATTVALAAINTSFIGAISNVLLTVVVDMFPTTLRAIAVSITMMIGRCGAIFGNLLFPYLLTLGCMPPFIMVGIVIIGCAFLALLLPKTDMKALE